MTTSAAGGLLYSPREVAVMIEDEPVRCPGCRVELPPDRLPPSDRYHASGECFALFTELGGHTLSLGDPEFLHQHVVDSYAAQHAGGPAKPIGVAYGLIGLCLHLEHGLNGREVQRVHMRIPRRDWPSVEPPTPTWDVTVRDVLDADSKAGRHSLIERWASSVWQAWGPEHEWVEALVLELIGSTRADDH